MLCSNAELGCICRLLGRLSQIQQQIVQPGHKLMAGGIADQSLSAQVDRLGICFVIATVQLETATLLLKVRNVSGPAVLLDTRFCFTLIGSRMCQLIVQFASSCSHTIPRVVSQCLVLFHSTLRVKLILSICSVMQLVVFLVTL